MYRQHRISRVFRASEYDTTSAPPIQLAALREQPRFEPVQLGRAPWPSVDDLEKIRKQAEDAGYQAGLQRAEEEQAAQRQRDALAIRHLLDGLARPFDDLNEALATEISTLALQIAATLAGQEIAANPELLVPIVVDAVAALPSHARAVTVALHPDDVDLIQQRLQVELDQVEFNADPGMQRGDCVVRSQSSTVDASLNARIVRMCQALPGVTLADES